MLRWVSKFELKPGAWVFVPTAEEVEFGNKLKREIESRWSPPNYYYHLRSGGHVAALYSHGARAYFLRLDIKDFFGRINRSRVTRNLKKYFSYDEARDHATRSTVKWPAADPVQYILPFGFVQSPLIASLCLRTSKLGNLLEKISQSASCDLSVYVDDIVVSADSEDELRHLKNQLWNAAEDSAFPVNLAKSTEVSDSITAFNVVLSAGGLRVSDERMQLFRAELGATDNPDKIAGIINYVKRINVGQSDELEVEFAT